MLGKARGIVENHDDPILLGKGVGVNKAVTAAPAVEPFVARGVPGTARRRRLVADVGGTFARLAWADGTDGQPVAEGLQRFPCADYSSLAAIVRAFAGQQPLAEVEAVVAIAGVVQGDTLVNANLPWPVSIELTRRAAGLAALHLINDFEAVALAVPYLQAERLQPLVGAAPHRFEWPALVLGPGTGLGAALRMQGGERPVLASEVGHAALAAGNEQELDVLRLLLRRWPHVDNERVLSGMGLLNLYQCLCELAGTAPQFRTTESLLAAANAHQDALAVETVQVFCGWLGSYVGDLAIAFGARAVYLTGGIPGHITGFLHDGRFAQRFFNKGVLSPVLATVPVWRVDGGELGVLGAVVWQEAGQ